MSQSAFFSSKFPVGNILGDPGADKGGEGKFKRAEKYMARRKVKNGEKSGALLAVLYFSSFHMYFSARLDFPSPPLSAPGSPRMSRKPRACHKLGDGPGVGKCPAPGQYKICKCSTSGIDKAGKCPAVARRGEGVGAGRSWN